MRSSGPEKCCSVSLKERKKCKGQRGKEITKRTRKNKRKKLTRKEEGKNEQEKRKENGRENRNMPDSSAYAALLHDNFIYKKF
jgi:hypothetical protein